MSAAIEIDGRCVTVNYVSETLQKAIAAADAGDYRQAMHWLCREVTRLSGEIEELQDRLDMELPRE